MAQWVAVAMQLTNTALAMKVGDTQSSMDIATMRYQARQQDEAATKEFAKGTRQSREIQRQGRVLESDIRATQAASGGVTSDAGAVSQIAKAKEVTQYNALSALFEAKSKANIEKDKASQLRLRANQEKRMGKINSLSTALLGSGNAMSSFGNSNS